MSGMKDNAVWKASKPFVTGSLSGMAATCCIQPMDMIKVRIQLGAAEGGSTSPVQIAKTMIANEGFMAMYAGLGAGLTRQVVYTGARLGLFDIFTEKSKDPAYAGVPGFAKKSICALSAGGIAAVAGTPADLALIRMQSDSMLPVEQRRNYSGVGHALGSIAKTDGVGGLFKGWQPTATRAMALNFGMLAFNAQAKEMLQGAGAPEVVQVFGASGIAGFFASAFSLPFDFVKTQIQKMKPDPVTGEMPFKGPIDCAMKQVQQGGITRLWSGFPTYYFRIAPHAMITLIAQDRIKGMWGTMGM
jgi:solute carrier family 25 oxoglutarate transporter 11